MQRRLRVSLALAIGVLVSTIAGGTFAFPTAGAATEPHHGDRTRPYFVYWDQNEEQDFLAMPSGRLGQLIPPYNPNGQMCILPGGRFVTGYNPTLPSQHNPGSLKPIMQPPVGEALWDRHGNFTGTTLSVPGPFKMPGQTIGGDIPPDPNRSTFNNNGTFTGCAVDRHANVFAVDLGTAQGQFPPPDDGRLIEWFAPTYKTFCIVTGPTSGGVGPHHVDGTGGLNQPGDLAFDEHGDLLMPVAGNAQDGLFSGRVLRFDHASFPRRAADCGPDGLYPRAQLRSSVFIQGSLSSLPFPQSIAHDPACDCWAVASVIGDPAITFFDKQGRPLPSMGPIHGESITGVGQDPNGINPFGIAFAPDGTLYIVDIHIQCRAPLVGCGPAANGGRVLKVVYTGGQPGPPTPVATGYNFPTSVTICVPHRQNCPTPARAGDRDDTDT
jgi:hypothetical protein